MVVSIFYGEGLQAPPQTAGEALPGTLVSLAAQKGGREGTDEERQREERTMGGRGHSLLTWIESTPNTRLTTRVIPRMLSPSVNVALLRMRGLETCILVKS